MRDDAKAGEVRWFSTTPRPSSPAANLAAVFLMGGALLFAIFMAHNAATTRSVASDALEEKWYIESAVRDVSQRVARDSIRRVLERLPNTPRVQLLATPETQAAVRYGTFQLLARNDSTATGRVVGVVMPNGWDSLPDLPPIRRQPFSAVPSQTDGRTCVTWMTVATGVMTSDTAYRGVRPDNRTGPCHLIAAFGLPSKPRMAWLDARSWMPAQLPDASQAFTGRNVWDADEGLRGNVAFMRALELTYSGYSYRIRSGLTARCMYGEGEACVRHVFGAGLAPGATELDSLANTASPLASARLIQLYGNERFRAWWTSPDTTSAGFAATFGQADSTFARQFVARFEMRRLPVPTLRLLDVLPPLVFMGILVAWLAVPARRDATV